MPTKTSTESLIRERRTAYYLQYPVISGTDSVYSNLSLTNSVTGGENPRWREQVRRHVQAGTGLQAQKQSYYGGYGSVYGYYHLTLNGVPSKRWSRTDGFLIPMSFPGLPSATGYADNQARSRFYKQAKEAQTAFRGLTFLGELGETLRMLRRPGESLRRGLRNYVKSVTKRTRRVRNRPALNRIVADTWLEHAFGWSPLIGDIHDAGKALNQRLERFASSYARVSAKGKEESYVGSTWSSAVQHYINRWRYMTGTTSAVTVRYIGEVRSVCPDPMVADMTLFGTDWKELVPTAWELVPWSFLVDYFLHIGDLLDAWSVRKSEIAWVVRTDRKLATKTVVQIDHYLYLTGYGANLAYPYGQTWSCSPATAVSKSVERSLISDVPLPSITWRAPGFGKKWINMSALALARSNFRKTRFR